MLSVSEQLGNQKPAALVAVEKAIWQVVFALAEGRLSPTKLLKTLADELPWSQIATVSEETKGWFVIGKLYNAFNLHRSYSFLQQQILQFSIPQIYWWNPNNLMKTTLHAHRLCH